VQSAPIVDKQHFRVRVDAGVPVAARDTFGMEEEQWSGSRSDASARFRSERKRSSAAVRERSFVKHIEDNAQTAGAAGGAL
jgi:hypothetical protein